MIPFLIGPKAFAFKKELYIVFGVLVVLLALPCIAVVSMTNVSALMNDSNSALLYTDPTYPGDLYDYGQCTYWAALRRAQIGEPIPNTWGNATTWAIRALLDGYTVNHVPSYGAIMQTPDTAGGLGHVAFVESVNPNDGDWTISEMNHIGWDETDMRTFPARITVNFNFIHERQQS